MDDAPLDTLQCPASGDCRRALVAAAKWWNAHHIPHLEPVILAYPALVHTYFAPAQDPVDMAFRYTLELGTQEIVNSLPVVALGHGDPLSRADPLLALAVHVHIITFDAYRQG